MKGWTRSFFPGWPQMCCCNQAGPSGTEGEDDVQANFLLISSEVNILTISGTLNVFLIVLQNFISQNRNAVPLEVYNRAIYWLGVVLKITLCFQFAQWLLCKPQIIAFTFGFLRKSECQPFGLPQKVTSEHAK